MAKIPAGKTILFAYGFLIGEIGTVVAATGFPALLYAGADYASRAYASSHPVQPGEPPGAAVALVGLGVLAVAVLASSVSAMAVTRVVFAHEGVAARQSFGVSVIRMAAANLRFMVGAVALIVFAVGVSYVAYRLAGVPLDGGGEIQPTASLLLASVVSWTVFAYAFLSMIRMGFLLPAVVSAEAKGGLKRSHDLTYGNTWRIVGIAFALGLPIVLLAGGAGVAVMRSALGPDAASGAVPAELVRRVQEAIAERLFAWEAFNAVIFVLYSGLMYGGAAYAYRAVAPRGTPVL
jgi:hypothetical protein